MTPIRLMDLLGGGLSLAAAGPGPGSVGGAILSLASALPVAARGGPGSRRRDHGGSAAAGVRDVAGALPEVDETAFASLYRALATPLAAYARRTLGDAEDAGDVVQECFFRYLRAGLPAGTDPAIARPYLFRSVSHLMRDRWRRAARDRRWRQGRAEPAPARQADRDLASDLDRALTRLKPRDRALLWLAHVEGESHRDIARVLDLAEASVRVMLFRARKRLEKVLVESDFPTETWR